VFGGGKSENLLWGKKRGIGKKERDLRKRIRGMYNQLIPAEGTLRKRGRGGCQYIGTGKVPVGTGKMTNKEGKL